MGPTSVEAGTAASTIGRESAPPATTPPHTAAAYPPGGGSSVHESRIRWVAGLTLAYSVFYITWRWAFTLNPAALWFAIPLVMAETYGLATSFFMTFTAWRLKRRVAPPAPPGLSVDVFVTTYDEPLTVIRKTALAAREINYPHTTWILDDGKRDEVRALARDLGLEYLRREDNEHAKAGNLNHALRHTTGEFILQLDADHVPLPHILDRLLGFMQDERVAFVQSPQDFYNTDAFTYEVNETARRIWEDQQLFFRVIQPGKDRLGAAFFVGSCAVVRRAALDGIGGFATATITEDIETSLLLHARGWRSVFYAETLAYGLAPGSAAAFHVQHLRWGQGAMQALRRYRPLTMPGLSLAQRIGYFDSLTTYLAGFQRLIFYLAPPVFFLTGTFPVRASVVQFACIFVPYLLLQSLSFKLLARGHGSLLLADRFGMAKFFTHIMAVAAFFTRGRLQFKVTPKGVTDVPFSTYAPQLGLAIITTAAVAWGIIALSLGSIDYSVPGWGSLAFWVNFVFAVWNVVVAVFIVEMSLRLKQKRQDHRYAEEIPIRVNVLREGRGVRARMVGISENLNPTGLALRTMAPIEEGDWVEVELPLSTRVVQAKGRVVHHQVESSNYGELHRHGVEFVNLPYSERDAIELHCSHHVTPIRRQRYHEVKGRSAPARWVRDPRRAPRDRVGMAARVVQITAHGERDLGLGLWEDTSAAGARIVLQDPVPRDARLRVEIPGTGYLTEGTVVFVRPLETSMGARFLIGLHHRPAAEAAAPGPVDVQPEERIPMLGRKLPDLIRPGPEQEPEPEPVPVPVPVTTSPEESVMNDNAAAAHAGTASARSQEKAPSLMSVWGGGARLDGKFDIDDSIEVRCEIIGEMNVGGRIVVEEGGTVRATVRTVDALIRGTYTGDMVATGSVHIESTGRVSGTVQTEELIIEKGGYFSGSVSRFDTENEESEVVGSRSTLRAVQGREPSQQAAARAEPLRPARPVREDVPAEQ